MENFVIPCIVVPLNSLAFHALNYNEANPSDLIAINLTRNQVHELFNKNFFQQINSLLDIDIDDFEDEEIIDIEKLIIFKEFISNWIDEHSKDNIYEKILDLVSIAIEKETGVFFFF
ncbi:hypothetical protein [Neisseria yangbaofengii]|uniref:hypothetical protein n=1 Tax=Neisseria yangbaofengii TaxID=2709396 RepID=UPI0013ED03AB|nr:hypothetical protein [Neisseria yangbaofengii]